MIKQLKVIELSNEDIATRLQINIKTVRRGLAYYIMTNGL